MLRFGFVLAASAVVLSGCASLNENECVTADWQSIGFQDGSQGQPVSASSRHRKACAKHGVTLDQYAYLQGHEQGVRTFCRPGKGFSLGAGGSGYAGVCPADLEPPFLAEYQKGRHLYDLERSTNAAYSALQARKSHLYDVNQDLTTKEAAVLTPDLTLQERTLIVLEIKDLIIERGELKEEIVNLEHEHAARYDELEAYRATLGYQYMSASRP